MRARQPPFAAELRLALLTLAALAVAPAGAAAQAVDVQVRVLDRATGRPVEGATVQLGTDLRAVTGGQGAARLTRVPLGGYTLTAHRLGYATAELEVVIRRDTLLVLALDVQPIPLDSIRATNRLITIRGTVRGADTRRVIPDAEVYAGPGRSAYTNFLGRFRLDRFRAGDTLYLSVTAFEYSPARTIALAINDTTIDFVLEPDPIGRAMLAQQIARLDRRVRSVGYSQRTIGRDVLQRRAAATAFDAVRMELGTRFSRIACVMIDDRQSMFGTDELHAYGIDQIDRLEIIDRGTMVRLYTRRFVQRMLSGRERVAPILLVRGTGRPICN